MGDEHLTVLELFTHARSVFASASQTIKSSTWDASKIQLSAHKLLKLKRDIVFEAVGGVQNNPVIYS